MKHLRLSLLAFWVCAAPVHASVWTIQPDCTSTPQCFTHPQDLTNWSRIAPGDTVLVHPAAAGAAWTSRFPGAATLSIDLAQGLPDRPIQVVGMAGVRIAQGVNIGRSAHLDIRGLDVSDNRVFTGGVGRAAVTIQAGSTGIRLTDSLVHDATGNGINISADAGSGLSIGPGNRIDNNRANGIAVLASGQGGSGGVASQIVGNEITRNGTHGVEVMASFWRVARNTVRDNGALVGGTSGIHLFSRSDLATPDCDHNEVLYNHVSGQRDSTAADGNGVQIDHFCDRNILAFNAVWGNAGAGISVVAGRQNFIGYNTVAGNATDLNRAATPALRGEILLASWPNFCWNAYVDAASCNLPAGRASGNTFMGNVIHSTQKAVPALHVNPDAMDPARNQNSFAPNLMFNAAGGPVLRWGERDVALAADVDRLTGLQALGHAHLIERPAFADPAQPGPAAHGLRLVSKPSGNGWPVPIVLPDLAGQMPSEGAAQLGAYYTRP